MMYEEKLDRGCESVPVGFIKEMTSQARANNGTARNISQRLQDLRLRLIGPVDLDDQKTVESGSQPTTVKAEVEELSADLDTSRRVQEEILNNLAQLERL